MNLMEAVRRTEDTSTSLQTEVLELLSQRANESLAKATWSKYSTAVNHLEEAEKVTGVHFSYPFTKGMVLAYIGYLLQRVLAAESINNYHLGIRQAHLMIGELPGCLRPEVTTAIYKAWLDLLG